MKTQKRPRTYLGPKLPAPPPHERDTVNDLGWLSRGPSKRAAKAAREELAPLFLEESEPSGLPPDPVEPPPLPEPPPHEPDVDVRGGNSGDTKNR
jgi:hypothetical protein